MLHASLTFTTQCHNFMCNNVFVDIVKSPGYKRTKNQYFLLQLSRITMSSLMLGVRIVRSEYQRIKVDNIDLNGNVDALRAAVSEKVDKQKQELELIYAGRVLEDGTIISSYGVKPGVTVHVLMKKVSPKVEPPKTLTDIEITQLVNTIGQFGYRTALQRLSRADVLEKIISSAPDLANDAAALALLQDPELVALMSDKATIKRVIEAHPALVAAVPQIIKQIKEESYSATQNQAGTSSGYSYSLDALSDGEDSETSEPREANPLQRNASYNAITAAQLAAAIASATTNFSSTGAVIDPPAAAAPNPNSSGPVITNEMFGNALQQAFASSAPRVNPAAPSSGEPVESPRVRFQAQLQQMSEMGLLNEGQNIRALQATSGNVQEAIELVFNGVIEPME